MTAGDQGPPFSIFSGGGLCDGRLFLADPRQSTVHQIDLADGHRVRALGTAGNDLGSLKSPETAIPDCDQGVVHVIDARGIVSFDLNTGAFIRRLPRAHSVGVALGPGLLDQGFLILPALHFATMDNFEMGSTALRGASLGYRQHASKEDEGSPMLGLLTEHCRSASPCTRVGIDRIRTSPSGWLGCQGAGHEVGIFGDDGQLRSRIDIRSPQFQDDGTTVRGSEPATRAIEWSQRNSSVIWCGAFKGVIATAHYTFEAGTWSPGFAMTPKVRLNIHRVDGTPVVADLALRDQPIARDESFIYVPVFGSGRNNPDNRTMELDRIRMIEGADLNPKLLQR